MIIIYSSIIGIALLMELSSKINTNNIVKKITLCFIIVGCFIHLAGKDNALIELGILGYFIAEIALCYLGKRRSNERAIN